MLEVLNLSRERQAYLENAYDIQETLRMNALGSLSFKLPYEDSKNDFCNVFWYVRREEGTELYRILPSELVDSEEGYVAYECEHVLATLLDKVMPGAVQAGGLGVRTREVLEMVLAQQPVDDITGLRDWVLGGCDFARQFEYLFEDENLLGAIFSVPQCFAEDYIWRTDTSSYPWRISLERFSRTGVPSHWIWRGVNRLSLIKSSDPKSLCTKLYARGAGEGVNQITIAEQTGGFGYVISDAEHLAKYGVKEKVWVDRRYTIAENLYGAAMAMLTELQDPIVQYECEWLEGAGIGDIVMIDDKIVSFVTEIDIAWDEVEKSSCKLANKTTDIVTDIAELADRQRIEATYSQGATNIYSSSIVNNADAEHPVELDFFIPSDMRTVNSVVISVKVGQFRAYSGTTSTLEQSIGSSGASSQRSSGSSSSNTGGAENMDSTGDTSFSLSGTTSSADNHEHGLPIHKHALGETGLTYASKQSTTITQGHSHQINIVGTHKHANGETQYNARTVCYLAGVHSHTLTFSAAQTKHTHAMRHYHNIEHTHEVTVPAHSHTIVAGINLFGNPTAVRLEINGVDKGWYNADYGSEGDFEFELDITSMLASANETIERGSYHTISFYPDDLAQIQVTYTVIGFIQSYIGGNY